MKKLLLVIISVLSFNSCSRENSPLIPVLTPEYFPLQVGNRWTFKSSLDSSVQIYEITDTKVFGEHDYFERVRTFSDGTKDTNYFRIDEDNIVLIYYEGDDYIYIDFEKPLEEEWNSFGDFYGYIKQRNISIQVEAGSFNNVIEVYMDNRSVSDAYEFSRYAPGVGLVESIRFRFSLTLSSARVNGINYP
jgi:hypothetical protein